jgi:predicted GNAT family acetyltransferase
MDIRHDAEGQRFFTTLDGHEAEVSYELEDGLMLVTHTGVPKAIGGRGVAGELNRAAFEHARREHLRVRPLCAYAAAWVKRNEEYADLVG